MSAFGGPQFAVPSIASTPSVGFGSARLGSGALGCGLGGIGFVHGGQGYGLSNGYGLALADTSGSLGNLAGVIPSGINQVPLDVIIEPARINVIIPGAILSAPEKPVSVGGYTPSAISGTGVARAGSYGSAGGLYRGFGGLYRSWGSRFGLRQGTFLRNRALLGHQANIC